MSLTGDKNLEFPKSILVFAAPCQGLRAAVATQGILYSTYVHEQVDVD
jgi:hypothetical protein